MNAEAMCYCHLFYFANMQICIRAPRICPDVTLHSNPLAHHNFFSYREMIRMQYLTFRRNFFLYDLKYKEQHHLTKTFRYPSCRGRNKKKHLTCDGQDAQAHLSPSLSLSMFAEERSCWWLIQIRDVLTSVSYYPVHLLQIFVKILIRHLIL